MTPPSLKTSDFGCAQSKGLPLTSASLQVLALAVHLCCVMGVMHISQFPEYLRLVPALEVL